MTAPDLFWRVAPPVFVLSSRDAQKVGGEWAGEKKQTKGDVISPRSQRRVAPALSVQPRLIKA